MLTGRSSSLVLLGLLAALSVETVACSQATTEESGAADQAIDAASLITLDPSLPFEVARVHVANGAVLNARWGAHNGPVATQNDAVSPGAAPEVSRWFIPATPGAPMGQQPWTTTLPTDLPSTGLSWSYEGFIDLPFGSTTLQSYTTVAEVPAGEVFLFSKNYDSVLARAHTNGFYSGVGVTNGTKNRVVYSGLSGFTADATTTSDNGVWASDITASSLVPANGSKKLFGWSGFSGPVVLDNDGNFFVSARVTGGEHKTAVYGITKAQSFADDAVQPVTLSEGDTEGTAAFAVANVAGSGKGWIFGKGFDTATPLPIYARPYKTTTDSVADDGAVIDAAIKPVFESSELSMFGDPAGNLWVAIKGRAGAWLIQLKPKAPQP